MQFLQTFAGLFANFGNLTWQMVVMWVIGGLSAGAGGSESDLKIKTHLQDFADAFFAMLYTAGEVQKTGFGPGAD